MFDESVRDSMSLSEVSRMIELAIERADAALYEDDEPELPLWDDRVHADAEANIAWRYVHGHRVVVSLVDADLLTDRSTGHRDREAALRLDMRAIRGQVKPVKVAKGRHSLGSTILRRLGPQPEGTSVDHIDRDPLNNRRSNLRWATPSEQAENTLRGKSKYFGVSFHKAAKRYRVTVTDKATGKTVAGPYYDTEIDTAKGADELSVKINGPDAKTNLKLGLLPPPDEQLTLPGLEPNDAAATEVSD